MARKILGNDPFTRGSALRPATPTVSDGSPMETPELQVPRKASRVKASTADSSPATPAEKLKAMNAEAKGRPKTAAKSKAKAPSPGLKKAPAPHGASPSLPADPMAHHEAPVAQPLNRGPVPHGSAPEATELTGAPVAHADAPRLMLATDTQAAANDLPAPSTGFFSMVRESLTAVPRAVASALGTGAAQVDGWGRDARMSAGLRPFADMLFERYWRVSVEGAHLIPTGACLLVANHSGALPIDGPLLHLAVRRYRTDLKDAPWLMEDQLFNAPMVGLLANRLGAVRANPENAFRLLREHRPVIVFPEGMLGVAKPFTKRHVLQRFGRGGAVKIALTAKVPIVPVAILGGEETSPMVATLPAGILGSSPLPITTPPLPARWFIQFGEPIEFDDAPVNAHEDLAWVAKTNEALREQIQGMVTNLVSARDRVF